MSSIPQGSRSLTHDGLFQAMLHRLRAEDVVARVDCPGYALQVLPDGDTTDSPGYLQVSAECLDATDHAVVVTQKGRKWRLSLHMTDGEIVQTALMALLAFSEHEIRERFTYRGVTVFDPHYDIEALVALRSAPGGSLKERT